QGDWLLMRRGDVFANPGAFQWQKSGPASGGWMRLGAYGDNSLQRPIIDTGSTGYIVISPGFQSANRIVNLAITDVHLLPSGRVAAPATATTAPNGLQAVAVQWRGSGFPFSNLLLENVRIQGYGFGFVGDAAIENLTIRRCIF